MNTKTTKIKQSFGDNVFSGFIYAFLSIVFVVILYPLLYFISASFSDPTAVIDGRVWLFPVGINLKAYEIVLQHKDLINGFINSIKYTLVGTSVNLIMTILGAYPLSRRNFRGRTVITIFYTFTMFFSGGLIPTYLLIKDLNLLNNFWVMVLPNAVVVYNLIITRTFFQNSIPNELLEAAQIDGCSNFKTLFWIVLPLSQAIIAVMAMFYGLGHWNAFYNALIYISDKSKYPLQLILRGLLIRTDGNSIAATGSESIAEQILIRESIKYSSIVVSSLPIILVFPFIQKFFEKGIMIGSIKG